MGLAEPAPAGQCRVATFPDGSLDGDRLRFGKAVSPSYESPEFRQERGSEHSVTGAGTRERFGQESDPCEQQPRVLWTTEG
jgi:hypothetical protein